MKILRIENPNETIQNAFTNYKAKHNIEELMVVNNDGDKVSINGIQNEEKISRLVLQVRSKDNEITFIDLKVFII